MEPSNNLPLTLSERNLKVMMRLVRAYASPLRQRLTPWHLHRTLNGEASSRMNVKPFFHDSAKCRMKWNKPCCLLLILFAFPFANTHLVCLELKVFNLRA